MLEASTLFAITAFASLPALTWSDTAHGETGSPAQTLQTATAGKTGVTGGVDALIEHLRDKFKITPAQEVLWQQVANVMLENAETMSKLAKTRSGGAKTMTAVDDLKSYSEISEAHAQGTKKLIPVFQALYDSMSVDQKKAADTEFQEHYRGHHHHRH